MSNPMRDTSAIQALIDHILRTDAYRRFTDLRDIARSAECELLRLASPAPVRAVRLPFSLASVPDRDGWLLLDPNDIEEVRFDRRGTHLTIIVLTNGRVHQVRETLAEVMSMLGQQVADADQVPSRPDHESLGDGGGI